MLGLLFLAAIADELLIVDTHIDVPYRLEKKDEDVSQASGGDFDYPRARQGGLNAAFMSIYIPAAHQTEGGAKALADKLIERVYAIASRAPDKFIVVREPAEVRAVLGTPRVALALGMENGAGIEGKLENLTHFYERGVRYVTLTHSKDNDICDSSYDDRHTHQGLSPFGKQVVGEMNRLGMIIDVSHVSDQAFWQVLALTRAPVLATHSSCRHFTPGFERNMSDDMIRALAKQGGVIQVNFGSSFIDETTRAHERDKKPFHRADVAKVADHILHVIGLAGVDHVGLGSDFDGVGDSLPTGLQSVADYPNLIAELSRRGVAKADLAKILGENTLRVWAAQRSRFRPTPE
jgi:membrane dipeptidase